MGLLDMICMYVYIRYSRTVRVRVCCGSGRLLLVLDIVYVSVACRIGPRNVFRKSDLISVLIVIIHDRAMHGGGLAHMLVTARLLN